MLCDNVAALDLALHRRLSPLFHPLHLQSITSMGYTRAVSRDLAKMLNRPFDGRNGSREYSKDKKRVAVLLAAVNARNRVALGAEIR